MLDERIAGPTEGSTTTTGAAKVAAPSTIWTIPVTKKSRRIEFHPNHQNTVGSHCACDSCHKHFAEYMQKYRATHRAYRNYQKKLKRDERKRRKQQRKLDTSF